MKPLPKLLTRFLGNPDCLEQLLQLVPLLRMDVFATKHQRGVRHGGRVGMGVGEGGRVREGWGRAWWGWGILALAALCTA